MHNYSRFGIFGILGLIALRLCIGWHFYMEGAGKVNSGNFTSEPFLKAAAGPLAPKFQELLWDNNGGLRLDQGKMNFLFVNAAEDAARHFGFTDDQKSNLTKLVAQYAGLDPKNSERYIGKLNEIYAEHDEEIYKFKQSEPRLEKMEASGTWTGVESLRGQKKSIEEERMKSVQPALASIDALWKQYERDLNIAADPEQFKSSGYFRFQKPGDGKLNLYTVDQIIPYFDMVVGILLIVGLLTPLAAWAAALFLISVVLSQMPGYPGTAPTYFQAVEAVACVVLATTDAGRYAGLDFIPWAWWNKGRKAKPA